MKHLQINFEAGNDLLVVPQETIIDYRTLLVSISGPRPVRLTFVQAAELRNYLSQWLNQTRRKQ